MYTELALCLQEIPLQWMNAVFRVSVVCERRMDIALTSQQKRPRGVTAQGFG